MATTATKIGTLDDYLNRICEQLQLSETQYETAVKRYTRVGEWLTEPEGRLVHLSPEVRPQGSMLQRTTIRPTRVGKEVVPFDIDTVCLCNINPLVTSSEDLYQHVHDRLVTSAEFKRRIKDADAERRRSGKCVKLAYLDDDFYLDVVPACKDPSDTEGHRLYICNPDKWPAHTQPIETWKRTDPFRFAEWLQARCNIGRPVEAKRASFSVAPVPPQEDADLKLPLRRVVQLLKRQRDLYFLGDECRPSSIMLTTLAGRHYKGQDSIADSLEAVLGGIASEIVAASGRRIVVRNPADEIAPHDGGIEDLAAPLDMRTYAKFCEMIEKLRNALAAARVACGVPKLYPLLSGAFGQGVVKRAFNSAEEDIERASARGLLGASVGGSQIYVLAEPKAGAGVQPVRCSDFHTHD
jgi:hypothetical protein